MIPLVLREFQSVALRIGAGVVVERSAIYAGQRPLVLLDQLAEEAAGPGVVGAIWTRGNVCQRYVEPWNPLHKAAELDSVFVAREVAAAAPTLVAHAPKTHIERLAGASRLA